LYAGRAELNSDDPQQDFAAGRFFRLSGDADRAIEYFRAAMKLDPAIPAKYYLAGALAEKKEFAQAQELLKTIAPNDPQYAPAQQLLSQIELNSKPESGPANQSAGNAKADALFREAQALYQDENYGGALKSLEDALRLGTESSWRTKAEIERAVCLAKLARVSEAEQAMKALELNPEAKSDATFQLAWVEMLYENGRSDEALKRVDDFIALVPNSPPANVWRAKVLLQLGRPAKAAKAAEESIHLQPEAPAAHNLLIRIYQMLGRTSDAEQQAQWMRDYERRIQGR
ncbi:MAG: tetratricopeptide repeat protein, partial [Acidobacteria bacterium]|nr:tetratricopeptide repeat protein [Acidobacteriota bacterium]